MFGSIRNKLYLRKLLKNGLRVGNNFNIENGVTIDAIFPWLIEIGDNVTLGPYARILAHDASTKIHLGYTKLGKVNIGNNVFVGMNVVILPGVTIGNNVVIGAGSIVTHNIEDNSVVAGNPAKKIIATDVYIENQKDKMNKGYIFDKTYTISNNIYNKKKNEMKKAITNKNGFIV